jgi:putative nucleotidyltransferase with HDIG domain
MKIEKTFLRSKVAQRVALLFVLCALLPIVILCFLSFSQVTKNLREQSQMRLHRTSKNLANEIFERLLFVEADVLRVASDISEKVPFSPSFIASGFDEYHKDRIKGLVLQTDQGERIPLFETISSLPELKSEERQQVMEGNTLLMTRLNPGSQPQIFLCLAIDPDSPEKNLLFAEVEPLYLWYMGFANPLPPMIDLIILDHQKNVLFSSFRLPSSEPGQVSPNISSQSSGQFEWLHDGKKYLASYRNIFFKPKFLGPQWTIITSESKSSVYSPLEYFKKTFPLAILLSFWVVLLLSFTQIRRSLVPLEKLKAGARRIAKGDFDTEVAISTRDEFAELAETFNIMTQQLGRQFKTLTTIAEIDRAILSSFDSNQIANTILDRIRDVFPCQGVGVTLLDPADSTKARTFLVDPFSSEEKKWEESILISKEVQELCSHQETLAVECEGPAPSYLAPMAQNGIRSFQVFPIFLQGNLAGIISLCYEKKPVFSQVDVSQARQLSDRVGVALANARLIEELSDFNWGTLKALARAIDAKSPWTAGHSERVTTLALEIGYEMDLSETEAGILRRGGLLHDIGKLGIPNKILDKTAPLTEEEMGIMQKHPELGARILEPIAAYTDIMLIVLQHHENYDGTGYPSGLAGEKISLYSRIFAVADRFEALTSDRPYRKAIPLAEAIRIIQKTSGSAFDPQVVEAFLKARKRKKGRPHAYDHDTSSGSAQRSPK